MRLFYYWKVLFKKICTGLLILLGLLVVGIIMAVGGSGPDLDAVPDGLAGVAIDTTRDDSDDLLNSINWKLDQPRNYPLTILTNRCEIIMPLSGSTTTNITFRSFLTTAVSTVDPWGMPYIYLPSDNAQAYTLFSCGPDRKSADIPTGAASTPDPTLDDIYFER